MLPDFRVELDWRGKRYRDIDRGLRAIGVDVAQDFDKLMPIVRRELRAYMTGVVRAVKARTTTPYPGGTSARGVFPGTLSRRSGELSRGLSPRRITVQGGADDVSVKFPLEGIAVVHETGATITPKKAQFLTIPLPAALSGSGVPLRNSAREWSNTFVQRSKRGNLLIFQKRGTGIIPLYVLKKSVTIPPRLAFEQSFEAGRDRLADTLAQQLLREFAS